MTPTESPPPLTGQGSLIQVMEWNIDSATAFQNLPTGGDGDEILLLTPAIPNDNISSAAALGMDPFERLGTVISSFHEPVQHVPYVPKQGLDKAHKKYLGLIPTVIMVVCEPSGLSADQIRTSLARQHAFAEAVAQEYHIANEGTEPASLALLYFGTQDYGPPRNVPIALRCGAMGDDVCLAVVRKLIEGHPG